MKKRLVFISSVQKEFKRQRRMLADYIRADALLGRFFEVFLFEDIPADGKRADDVYLDEVKLCDVYLGIFGDEYGTQDSGGKSATHREFEQATSSGKHRLIFVKGAGDADKHAGMQALVKLAGEQAIRRRFVTSIELQTGVYASLVQYLIEQGAVRTGPFDASACNKAALTDLDEEKIR